MHSLEQLRSIAEVDINITINHHTPQPLTVGASETKLSVWVMIFMYLIRISLNLSMVKRLKLFAESGNVLTCGTIVSLMILNQGQC